MGSVKNIVDLPADLINLIRRYLFVKDSLNLAATCKIMRKKCQQPLLKKRHVNIREEVMRYFQRDNTLFINSTRAKHEVKQILRMCDYDHVESLSFGVENPNIQTPVFMELLDDSVAEWMKVFKFDKIQTLSVDHCALGKLSVHKFGRYFPNVLTLHLSKQAYTLREFDRIWNFMDELCFSQKVSTWDYCVDEVHCEDPTTPANSKFLMLFMGLNFRKVERILLH